MAKQKPKRTELWEMIRELSQLRLHCDKVWDGAISNAWKSYARGEMNANGPLAIREAETGAFKSMCSEFDDRLRLAQAAFDRMLIEERKDRELVDLYTRQIDNAKKVLAQIESESKQVKKRIQQWLKS